MKPKSRTKKPRIEADKISLAPLKFDDAIRAAMATGKAPPAPKRAGQSSKK